MFENLLNGDVIYLLAYSTYPGDGALERNKGWMACGS
jgi:hypothetical protein